MIEADEKTCPRCAETVKAAAQVCRFCGFDFASAPRIVADESDLLSNFNPSGAQVLKMLAVVIGAVMVMQCVMSSPDQSTPPKPVALVDAKTRASCSEVLVKGQKTGVIRERPSRNRVNVDEVIWAQMAASDKTALLSLVACDAFGKRQSDLEFGEHTVAYGWRSGKRLAMLSSAGMSFE